MPPDTVRVRADTTGWAEDERAGYHDHPLTQNPAFLLFSRENGLLREHPITDGRNSAERVNVVMTFTGQAMTVPGGAFALLPLSETAREYPYRRSRESESRPAAGLTQAVALNHGNGRVVMFGEAAALTAQASGMSNGGPFRFRINRGDLDNAQLVLNVLHWLTGLL